MPVWLVGIHGACVPPTWRTPWSICARMQDHCSTGATWMEYICAWPMKRWQRTAPHANSWPPCDTTQHQHLHAGMRTASMQRHGGYIALTHVGIGGRGAIILGGDWHALIDGADTLTWSSDEAWACPARNHLKFIGKHSTWRRLTEAAPRTSLDDYAVRE